MDKLIAILGPTAIGKSSIGIELAKKYKSPIISCDSIQVYKGMDIGTAKVTLEEQKEVPHYLLDVSSPDEEYNVESYREEALEIIKKTNNEDQIPFVVGGTGLYFNSLIYDLSLGNTAPNEELRRDYEKLVEDYGVDYLHDLLKEKDPISAEKIHPNNIKRVIRALEIFDTTGQPMSRQNKGFRKKNPEINLLLIGLNVRDRKILHERIEKRIHQMIDDGLVEEVQALIEKYDENSIAFEGIGYKEVIPYIKGEWNKDRMIERLIVHTRQLAKRQISWFNRLEGIHWFYTDELSKEDLLKEIDKKIIGFTENPAT